MTPKKVTRVWLMNCLATEPDPKELAFRKGYMPRLYNDTLLEVDRPRATEQYTVEQLEGLGLVGLYGYRFVRPIMDYQRLGKWSRMQNGHL